MPSQKDVTKNTFAQATAKIAGAVLSLWITKMLTSQGQAFYGSYKVAYDFLAFFGIIADMGLFTIAVREMSRSLENSPKIIGNVLSVRLIFIAIVTILAGSVAQLIPAYNGIIATGVWITGLSMALTITAGTLSSVLQARMKIHWFSMAFFLGKVVLAASIFVILSSWTGGSEGLFFTLLWAGVASNLLFCSIVAYAANRYTKIKWQWDHAWIMKTLKSSLPYGVGLILQTLYLRLDLVLISILRGASPAGIYGIAASLLENLRVVGVFFSQALLPRFTKKHSQGDDSKSVSWAISWGLTLAIPIVVGGVLYRRQIILLLSNNEFLTEYIGSTGSDVVLQILLFTLPFFLLNQIITSRLIAQGRHGKLLKVNGVALLLNAVLNVIGIPIYGIIAAAISTVFSEILVLILLLHLTPDWRKLFPVQQFLRISSAVITMALFIVLTPLKDMFILGGLFSVVVYFLVLWALGGIQLPATER